MMALAPLPLLALCAASFPDYAPRPAADYPLATAKSGLIVVAHPLDNVNEQQTYFGSKLLRKGYLPVLIVI
ncbi:MAG: hypothetical protein ACRD96_20295, partial [Bryobacteraceae bacterium]